MLPNGLNFIDTKLIPNSVFNGNPTFASSNHPSLNTYSRMSAGEDNCALVWQHSPNTNTYYKNILYTRLKVENDTLKTYSALGNSNLTIQNNIAKVTADYGTPNSNQFPVVYRSLDSLNYSLGFPYNKTDDIIVWQNTIANYQSSNINGRVFTSRDSTSGISKSILGWMPVALQDNYKYSFLPDLAQQSGLLVGGTIKFPYGKYVMNFVRGDANGYRTFNFPATGSWVSDINVMGNNFSTINEISLQTKQPHLAKYKEINITNNIWRNRRVYEEYINNNYSAIPNIVSNGRFFYKNNVVNELEAESFVGFNKGSSKYQISLPTVNNQLVSLQLPFIPIMDSTSYINYDFDNSQDTIFSNWFDVDMVGNLNFKCYGFNDTIMKAQIQRQSDNVFFDLNLPVSTTDTTGKLGEYTLINGGLNSYRLCFTRLDTNYQYTETLVLDGLPLSDTVMLKSNGSNKQIIDLSGRFSYNLNNQDFNILISPNPVDEVVYLTPLYSNLSNKNIIEIEIFDNLGNVIAKIKTKSGESVEYDTKDLSNGVYFVKCSEFIDEWFLPTLLKTTKFIVNR